MMKRLTAAAAVLAAAFGVTGPVMASETFTANLNGFEEVPSIATGARGFLLATLNDAGTQLDYQLYYLNLSAAPAASHIHIGQKSVNGGVVLFFCTNGTPPAGAPVPPACPNAPGINFVGGSLTAANVVAVAGQGIAAWATGFQDIIRAIRAGNAYANLHTSNFAGGEMRGQIR